MADGEVVFSVKVDTTQVTKDMAALRATVTAGMAALSVITSGMALAMGNAISGSFNSARGSVSSMCAAMNAGAMTGAAAMSGLAGAIGAAGARLAAMCALNTAGVSAMLDKLNALSLGKITAATVGVAALTSSLYAYVAAVSAANAATLTVGSGTGSSSGGKTSTISSAVKATGKSIAAKMSSKVSKLRSGKEYIPYDDYPALLHKGEAVLTAGENAVYRGMGGADGIAGLTAARQQPIAVENRIEVSGESAPQNINLSVELDGYQVAKAVGKATNELSRQLNARVIKQ